MFFATIQQLCHSPDLFLKNFSCLLEIRNITLFHYKFETLQNIQFVSQHLRTVPQLFNVHNCCETNVYVSSVNKALYKHIVQVHSQLFTDKRTISIIDVTSMNLLVKMWLPIFYCYYRLSYYLTLELASP